MMIEGTLTVGGPHTMQDADDVLSECVLETYIIVWTNDTLINWISKM